MVSPFERHRDLVLGHYSTAAWLRSVVMAMWNGSAYQAGLTNLRSLDQRHFEACMEMFAQYHAHGENDAAFMRLADEVRQRLEEEEEAVERGARPGGLGRGRAHGAS